MRIGIVVPTFDPYASKGAFEEIVQAIEQLGFPSAWVGDHIVFPQNRPAYLGSSWMDAMTSLSVGLGLTKRLRFGTDVLVAAYRNPILLAKMAATASRLSGGRVTLGVGIGWLEGEFEALNTPPFKARAEVMEEYLQVMRLLFEEEGELSFEGKWTSFSNVMFEPKPEGNLPLLIGGNHPKALRRAALLGDGWHPLFLKPDEYAAGRAEIERIRREEGITRPFIFSMSGSEARIVESAGPAEQTRTGKEGTSYAPSIGVDESGRQRFIGSAEQVLGDCLALAEAGVEQLVLRLTVPLDAKIGPKEHLEQLRRFADSVLPHIVDA